MKIPGFLLKFIGRQVAKKLDLQEGKVESKKIYKSKTFWSDVMTIIVAIVGFADSYFASGQIATNPAYQGVLTVLGALGIYGRKTATTHIQ